MLKKFETDDWSGRSIIVTGSDIEVIRFYNRCVDHENELKLCAYNGHVNYNNEIYSSTTMYCIRLNRREKCIELLDYVEYMYHYRRWEEMRTEFRSKVFGKGLG